MLRTDFTKVKTTKARKLILILIMVRDIYLCDLGDAI